MEAFLALIAERRNMPKGAFMAPKLAPKW